MVLRLFVILTNSKVFYFRDSLEWFLTQTNFTCLLEAGFSSACLTSDEPLLIFRTHQSQQIFVCSSVELICVNLVFLNSQSFSFLPEASDCRVSNRLENAFRFFRRNKNCSEKEAGSVFVACVLFVCVCECVWVCVWKSGVRCCVLERWVCECVWVRENEDVSCSFMWETECVWRLFKVEWKCVFTSLCAFACLPRCEGCEGKREGVCGWVWASVFYLPVSARVHVKVKLYELNQASGCASWCITGEGGKREFVYVCGLVCMCVCVWERERERERQRENQLKT